MHQILQFRFIIYKLWKVLALILVLLLVYILNNDAPSCPTVANGTIYCRDQSVMVKYIRDGGFNLYHPTSSQVSVPMKFRQHFNEVCDPKLNLLKKEVGKITGHVIPENVLSGGHWYEGSMHIEADILLSYIYVNEYLLLKKNIPTISEYHICQVGFNYGLSTVATLCGFENINVEVYIHSFDLGEHAYVQDAFNIVSKIFEKNTNLHQDITLGDSTKTVRETEYTCDTILIDGGHFGNVPMADILNFQQIAKSSKNSNVLMILDDCTTYEDVGKAMFESLRTGVLKYEPLYFIDYEFHKISFCIGRYII